jgi:hypothetical protein
MGTASTAAGRRAIKALNSLPSPPANGETRGSIPRFPTEGESPT